MSLLYGIDKDAYLEWKKEADRFSLFSLVSQQEMEIGFKKLMELIRRDCEQFDYAFYLWHGNGD